MAQKMIPVEVAHIGEKGHALIALSVTVGTTVFQAIQQSGILQQFPELKILQGRVGIFGKIVTLETSLREGDRVEIYRELKRDPKEARRARTKRKTFKKKS